MVPAQLLQARVEVGGTREKSQRAEFAEARGTLAIAVFAGGDDGHEGHLRVARGEGIVDIVAEIERAGRIALTKNSVQSFGMRLPFRVVHRDDRSKVLRRRPAFERERKFLPRASRKKIQFKPPRPFLNLSWRYNQFFVSNVPGLAVAAPVKFLECRARFCVRSGVPERTYPRGHHVPIIVETGLALPLMQLGERDALAGDVAHRLQRRPPVRASNVNKHPIDIKDQDFSWWALFRDGHANIGAETAECGNLRPGTGI
jgi:hypothetical protein